MIPHSQIHHTAMLPGGDQPVTSVIACEKGVCKFAVASRLITIHAAADHNQSR